jgi:hypothetical protein
MKFWVRGLMCAGYHKMDSWKLLLVVFGRFSAQNAYEILDQRINAHRLSQNFIIPEFIFNCGKLGDYKIFGKLLHSVKFR